MPLALVTEQRFDSLEFAGWPGGWLGLCLVLGAVGILAGVLWLYRRESRAGAPLRLRFGLAAMRGAALLALLLVWLEPVVATYLTRTIEAVTIVLVDRSASMSISDTDDAATPRIQQVAALLNDDERAWLRQLAQRNAVHLYSFGEQVEPLARIGRIAAERPALTAETLPSALTATQSATDFGAALTVALEDAGDAPIAGVVVFSDGNFNRGLSAADAAAIAQRAVGPLYAVGVGGAREALNLRVAELSAPVSVPKGDPIQVTAALEATGVTPTEVIVMLTQRGADADPNDAQPIAQRTVAINGDGETPLRFEVAPGDAGEFVYRLEVTQLDGETLAGDNIREVGVTILETRLRVLIVSGRPSFAYRYLMRLLERDRTVDVSCWLQSADENAVRDGNTIITELPRDPEALFSYDAILLLDPDPAALDAAWALNVRRFVDELGGGLLVQAGPQYAARFLRDTRLEELRAVLPIVAEPDLEVRLSARGSFASQPFALRVPDEAAAHPVMQFHPDNETTREIWSRLPSAYWSLPVTRMKPLATKLLMPTTTEQPLLSVQPFGAGRVAYLAFEDTWRWRATAEPYFRRFWIQLVRYLAQSRREGASKRGAIVFDRETFRPGDYARIEARVLDREFVPWAAPEVDGTLELPDGSLRPLTLAAQLGREGWFATRVPIDWAGPAYVRIALPGAEAAQLVKRMEVQSSDRELRQLALNDADLRLLAERTGGAYVALADADGLPDQIANASRERTERGSDRPLWDHVWTLVLIAALLAVEWTLRRRNHLL